MWKMNPLTKHFFPFTLINKWLWLSSRGRVRCLVVNSNIWPSNLGNRPLNPDSRRKKWETVLNYKSGTWNWFSTKMLLMKHMAFCCSQPAQRTVTVQLQPHPQVSRVLQSWHVLASSTWLGVSCTLPSCSDPLLSLPIRINQEWCSARVHFLFACFECQLQTGLMLF